MVTQEAKTTRAFTEAARLVSAELTTLATPEQAARSAGNERFEVIFVDPDMAHFSRQGFTRLVRTSRLNSESPIVLLSGGRVGTLAEDAATAGVTTLATPLRSVEILPYLQDLACKLLADRRKNRRLAFRTGVVCVQGLTRFNATSINISATGIQMEMNRAPKSGEEMGLRFQLELRNPIFFGRGRVVRIENSNRVSLCFTVLQGNEQVRLRRFIEIHLTTLH